MYARALAYLYIILILYDIIIVYIIIHTTEIYKDAEEWCASKFDFRINRKWPFSKHLGTKKNSTTDRVYSRDIIYSRRYISVV